MSDKDTRDPAWLPLLLDMGRNEFYADQQIIPIFNDGTWKAVADYVSALRARLAAAERVVEAAKSWTRVSYEDMKADKALMDAVKEFTTTEDA